MSFPRVPQDRLSLTQGATQLKNLIEWKHILPVGKQCIDEVGEKIRRQARFS